MNIKILKLVTSEEIICKLEESISDIVKIDNPFSLVSIPVQGNQVQLSLIPWMPASKKREFEINRKYIITIVDPPTDLYNHYNEEFGSGIAVPDNSIISP